MNANRTAALLLAAVLVLSAVSPMWVGLASASTYSKTLDTTSSKYAQVDTSEMTGGTYTYEVYVNASEVPGRDGSSMFLVSKGELHTSSDSDRLTFVNGGAYSEVKIVLNTSADVSGEPTFGVGIWEPAGDTWLGNTGGSLLGRRGRP